MGATNRNHKCIYYIYIYTYINYTTILKRQSDKAVPFAAHGGGLSLLLPELLSVRKLSQVPANLHLFSKTRLENNGKQWKKGLKGHSKHMRPLKTFLMKLMKPVNHHAIAQPQICDPWRQRTSLQSGQGLQHLSCYADAEESISESLRGRCFSSVRSTSCYNTSKFKTWAILNHRFQAFESVLVCLRVACPFCHLTAGTCSDVQDHILKQIDIAYGGGMTYVDYNSLFLLRFYVQNLSKSMQLCVAILQDLLSVFQYLVLSAGPVSKICTDVGLFSRRWSERLRCITCTIHLLMWGEKTELSKLLQNAENLSWVWTTIPNTPEYYCMRQMW